MSQESKLNLAWVAAVGNETLAREWWNVINNAYCEPQRAYHTLRHIEKMYELFVQWREELHLANMDKIIVFAIVFHDIVYDPASKSNEVDSIGVFKRFVEQVPGLLTQEEVQLIHCMIHATISHQIPSDAYGDDKHVIGSFLDLDLSILGQAWEEYEGYTKQIRQEYCIYSDNDFKNGRASVLRSFLKRDRLYFTDIVKEAMEANARMNLARELEQLTS